MSPLLRHPGLVPSLFSDRSDAEDAAPARRSVPARIAGRCADYLASPGAGQLLAAFRVRPSILAGSALTFLVCGRPLLQTIVHIVAGAVPG